VALALDYRQRFHRDVVVDLVCYRRYGHNEGDEPSYTQPLMYQKIKEHPAVAHLYGDQLLRDGTLTPEECKAFWEVAKERLEQTAPPPEQTPLAEAGPPEARSQETTGPSVPLDRLSAIVQAVSTVPEDFALHPKLQSLLRRRAAYLAGGPSVDWAGAELLAFGMCLLEGIPVRLAGQDSGRGTFSQRHAVFADYHSGLERAPLNTLASGQAPFEVLDSLLSENAAMAFEYGYSVTDRTALVLWEAQFGDFSNGAQVVIDQFLSGSEQKWHQTSGLVLLLPHGQEGQGPEHSSARLERFLTLCAEDNMRVANPTTPAQYYRLLLRQARDATRKPLVIMTPKSLLRHPKVLSSLEDLVDGAFQPVMEDGAFSDPVQRSAVRRVLVANGKVVYDLVSAREEQNISQVAILRLEQLYPFPGAGLEQALASYPPEAEVVFVQEEPRNMGAWRFVREQFLDGKVGSLQRPLRYVGRPELANTAPGSHRAFRKEQDALVAEALGSDSPSQ